MLWNKLEINESLQTVHTIIYTMGIKIIYRIEMLFTKFVILKKDTFYRKL